MSGRLDQNTLWLVPPPEEAYALESLIQELSNRFNTPVFSPHITLLSEIDKDESSIKKIKDVLVGIEKFDIQFEPASEGTHSFWQCVFLPVLGSPNLTHLRQKLMDLEISGKQPNDRYFPHLSLVYGTLDESQRKELLEIVKKHTPPGGFHIDKVVLFKCVGVPEEWSEIESFPL